MSMRIKIWEGLSTHSPSSIFTGASMFVPIPYGTDLGKNISDPPYRVSAFKNFMLRGYFEKFANANDVLKIQWIWVQVKEGEPFFIHPGATNNTFAEIPDKDLVTYIPANGTSAGTRVGWSMFVPEVKYEYGYFRTVGYKQDAGVSVVPQVGGIAYMLPNVKYGPY